MGFLKFTFLMLSIIFFLVVIVVTSTVEHEYLHQLIFKNYGINSTVKYYFWESFVYTMNNFFDFNIIDSQPAGVTYPDQNSTGVCNETCEMLHTQVEIVDHGATTIISTIFVLFILSIFYLEFVRKKETVIAEEEKKSQLELLQDEYYSLTGRKWKPFISYLSD